MSARSATPYGLRSKGTLTELMIQKKQINSRERIKNVLSKTKFQQQPERPEEKKKQPLPRKEAMRNAVNRKQQEQGKSSEDEKDQENRSPNIKEVVAKAAAKTEEPVSNQKSSGQTRS